MFKDDIPYKNYDHAAKMEEGYSFTIDRDGRWYCHDPAMGVGPIRNERIAKLFAGAGTGKFAGKGLSRDAEGRYWLKAPPNDVYGIDVEDVPFIVSDFRFENDELILVTNFGEEIALTDGKTFILRDNIPYIDVRNGLLARFARNVFYALAQKGSDIDGQLGVKSGGQWHSLGSIL